MTYIFYITLGILLQFWTVVQQFGMRFFFNMDIHPSVILWPAPIFYTN